MTEAATETINPNTVPVGTWAWIKVDTTSERVPSAFSPDDTFMAVRRDTTGRNTWIILLPTPSSGANHAQHGWQIERHVLHGVIRDLGLRPFVGTHRGWFARAKEVVEIIESPTWCPTHQVWQCDQHGTPTPLEEQLAAARKELADFKAKVAKVGSEAAEEHGWCSVFDEIMDELDLPGRICDQQVTVRVTYEQTVTIRAASPEIARSSVAPSLAMIRGVHQPRVPISAAYSNATQPTNLTVTVIQPTNPF